MAAPSLSMPLSKNLEDQLPLTAPEAAHPLISPSNKVHYSIYTTTPLTPHQQALLLSKINNNDLGSQTCRLAPEHPSSLISLREAYTHHLQHRNRDASIHPYLFFVIDNESYENLLLINLKAPTERKDVKSVIGVLRCGIEEADLLACNFDVGNIDWIEGKESERAKWGWGEGEGSVYFNPRYFASDPRSPDKTAQKQGSEIKRRRRYAWYSLIRGALRFSPLLEPTFSEEKDPSNTTFTLAGSFHASSNDPLEEIKKSFPYICWMDARINRNILLVLTDTEGIMEIYRALWDAEKELARFPFQEGLDVREQENLRAVRNLRTELDFIKETTAEEALQTIQEMNSQGVE